MSILRNVTSCYVDISDFDIVNLISNLAHSLARTEVYDQFDIQFPKTHQLLSHYFKRS